MNETANPRADKQELIDVLIAISVVARRLARMMEEERMEKNHAQNG